MLSSTLHTQGAVNARRSSCNPRRHAAGAPRCDLLARQLRRADVREPAVRREAARADARLQIIATYEEQASAAKARPEYARMMGDAHRGMFDVLIVWALDRFGRSMVGNMQAVLELDRRGVEVVSVREPWLDTGGAVRPLLIAIFSWVAEQERSRLSERTKAGMERARRDGVHIGRPAARVDVRRARSLRADGLPLREIAARLRVYLATLKRAMAGLKSHHRSRRGMPASTIVFYALALAGTPLLLLVEWVVARGRTIDSGTSIPSLLVARTKVAETTSFGGGDMSCVSTTRPSVHRTRRSDTAPSTTPE